MTSREFCYWLQGFFELQAAGGATGIVITAAQLQCVQNHLNMVFKHEIDPSQGSPEHQAELSEAHEGKLPPGDRPPVTVEQVKQLIKENPPSHFSSHGTVLRC
jgi:hypothetical protein